jgi:hypothetical protein
MADLAVNAVKWGRCDAVRRFLDSRNKWEDRDYLNELLKTAVRHVQPEVCRMLWEFDPTLECMDELRLLVAICPKSIDTIPVFEAALDAYTYWRSTSKWLKDRQEHGRGLSEQWRWRRKSFATRANKYCSNLLVIATRENKASIVDVILRKTQQFASGDVCRLIFIACQSGSCESLRVLLTRSTMHYMVNRGLQFAIQHRCERVLKTLVVYARRVDTRQLLFKLIQSRRGDAARWLAMYALWTVPWPRVECIRDAVTARARVPLLALRDRRGMFVSTGKGKK